MLERRWNEAVRQHHAVRQSSMPGHRGSPRSQTKLDARASGLTTCGNGGGFPGMCARKHLPKNAHGNGNHHTVPKLSIFGQSLSTAVHRVSPIFPTGLTSQHGLLSLTAPSPGHIIVYLWLSTSSHLPFIIVEVTVRDAEPQTREQRLSKYSLTIQCTRCVSRQRTRCTCCSGVAV